MKKIVSKYLITFISGVMQILGGVLLTKFAYDYLKIEQLNLWFLIIATFPIMSLMELGANVTMPRILSVKNAELEDKYKFIFEFISASLIIYLTISLLCLATFTYAYIYALINLDELKIILSLVFVGIFRIVGNISHATLYSMGNNQYEKIVRIINIILMLVIGLLCLKLEMGVYSLIIALLMSSLASIFINLKKLNKLTEKITQKPSIKWENLKKLLSKSIRYLGIGTPGLIVYNSSAFIIASKLDAQSLVEYGIIQQIVAGISMVAFLPISLNLPSIVDDNKINNNKNLEKMIENIALISALSFSLMAINFEFVMNIWLNQQNQYISVFAMLYFTIMFVEWLQSSLTTVSMAVGNLNYITTTILSGIMVLILMPILIGWYGLIGVPIAIFIAQCTTCHPYNIYISLKTLKLNFIKYLLCVVPSILVIILMIIVNLFLERLNIELIIKFFSSIFFGLLLISLVYIKNNLTGKLL